MQLQGFVRNTVTRPVDSKKTGKRYTVYDAEIHADDGQKTAISFGFDKPEVREGDYVRLEAFEERGFLNVDKSTIVRLQAPAEQPKAAAPAAEVKQAAHGAAGGDFSPREYSYQTHPTDARRITFAAANERAIKTVALLLAHDALPHSKAKGKGGEAQRYQELMAAIDKVTVKIFHDSLTLRTLDVIADEGIIDVKAQSDLPDAEPSNAALLDD